jgi:hypothetical protein
LERSEPPEKDALKIPVEVRNIFPDVKNVLFEVKNVSLDVKSLVLDVLKVLRRSGRLSVPALVRCAALKIAARSESRNKTIAAILPDSGERCLSTRLSDLDE